MYNFHNSTYTLKFWTEKYILYNIINTFSPLYDYGVQKIVWSLDIVRPTERAKSGLTRFLSSSGRAQWTKNGKKIQKYYDDLHELQYYLKG